MSTSPIIIAYDGTANADDAVALGSQLAAATGAPLTLAHVYRAVTPSRPAESAGAHEREQFVRARAQEVLAQGARLVDDGVEVAHEAIASTTTATGIRTLAEREHASLVIFGSAANTTPGRVHAGSAARRLLQVLPSALAIVPVGFHERGTDALTSFAVAGADDLRSAAGSAEALAGATQAQLLDTDAEHPSLVFVGSGPAARQGHLMVNARGSQVLQRATVPVIVVPSGRPLEFSPASSLAAA